MRRPRALTPLLLAAGLAGCAGGPSSDLGPLADQADRVADLVERGEDCRAVEAVRTLQTMADGDPDPTVRDAVTRFAADAQRGMTCEAGDPTGPAPTQQPDPRPPDERGEEDEGRGDEGRGNGREGRGNGDEGRGNSDEGGGNGDEGGGDGDEGGGNGTEGHERDEEARGNGDRDDDDDDDD